MAVQKVLIDGEWRESDHQGTFVAQDPRSGADLAGDYPVSHWADLDSALKAAAHAAPILAGMPGERISEFLRAYADGIEEGAQEIAQMASLETALPLETRLLGGELPRTTGQLRQAAAGAAAESWRGAVIDTKANIRSQLGAAGPVLVFGPNNFPLAFGSISGGDFAAALGAGNPVIGKAHPLHPGTSRLLAEVAHKAATATGMPAGTVQMIYHTSNENGARMVQDPRLAMAAFTGSRAGGLKLKEAADKVGKPIYLELGSINPVVLLPGALAERGREIAEELTGSCLMGTGQFCTNPGLVIVESGGASVAFLERLTALFQEKPSGLLFSRAGVEGLGAAVAGLVSAGASCLVGGKEVPGDGFSFANTLLSIEGAAFLGNPQALQAEAFGNATLVVQSSGVDETLEILAGLEGNLTGCVYSDLKGSDDSAYDRIVPLLRQKVGRLLNDQMPTGVAVSPAMNHGGPFPATAHPGFTAVGLPASMKRFAMLQCYDNVRAHRLPPLLRDKNELGAWRQVDGQWTQKDLA